MQENDFEKQAKELMDNFYVVPSEPVWNKIKRQLKEKRRRVWPFIFFTSMLIILSGALIYFNVEKNNQTSETKNFVHSKKIILDTIKQATLSEQNNYNQTAQKKVNQKIIRPDLTGKRLNNYALSNNQNLKNSSLDNRNNYQNIHSNAGSINGRNETVVFVKDKVDTNYIADSKEKSILDINEDALKSLQLNTQQNVSKDSLKEIISHANIVDKIVARVADSNKVIVQNNHNDSSKTKSKKSFQNIQNKLQFGILVFAGKSNISSSFLNLDDNKFLQDYSSVPINNGTVGGGNYNTQIKPSKLYSSFSSYGIGAIINKPIARHIYITSGLNFLYLSAITQTGNRIDSLLLIRPTSQSMFSLNNYYRTGSLDYKNHFQFLEIPLSFNHDFIFSKKITVSYNAGFSIRQLIGAHALIYDVNKNAFYSKNDMLNHTQFQVLGGLNFQFNLKNKSAIFVGPLASYSLSGFLKSTDDKKLHYGNYGLKAGWLFNKK